MSGTTDEQEDRDELARRVARHWLENPEVMDDLIESLGQEAEEWE